jgi:hypothetical protein
MIDNPFDNIESAHRYLSLLGDAVTEARVHVGEDLQALGGVGSRRQEALTLVSFKLSRLKQHLESSRFILNDLRMLRRLLLGERDISDAIGDAGDVSPEAQPPQVSAAP